MNPFINPVFWITTIIVYLLLALEIPRRRTLRFGIVNTGALAFLLGWKIAVGAFILSLFTWAILHITKRWLSFEDGRYRTVIGTGTIILFTTVFLLHKFNMESDVVLSQLSQLFAWGRLDIILPLLATLSFSYVYLRCMDLIISIIWKNKKLLDPLSLLGFILPFHMLLAGPVNVYQDHVEIDQVIPDTQDFKFHLSAINIITTGIFYKLVIAEGMRIYVYGFNTPLTVTTWSESAFFVIYMFFDFAGYSKVAQGLGTLYGVPTPQNFSLPFSSKSVTELWTRWHISLGDFVRRNIFIPAQLHMVRSFGLKWAYLTNALTLIISFGLVGLWHRISWSYLSWGIAMGVTLALEKSIRDYALKHNQNPGMLYTWGIRILGPVYVFIVFTTSIYFIAYELL